MCTPCNFLRQKYKILFVLKEANRKDGDADLCEFLLSESSPTYRKTWNNVARWIKALLVQGDHPEYVSRSDKSFWLRKAAVMNLKKVGGGSSSNDGTIREYSRADREFLKEQIVLYQPDIIICCGRGNGKNADILRNIIFEPSGVSEWQTPLTDSKYNYFTVKLADGKITPVVSFYHPQIYGGHKLFRKRYEKMLAVGKELGFYKR